MNEKEILKLAEYLGVKISYNKIIVSVFSTIAWIVLVLFFFGIFPIFSGNKILAIMFIVSYFFVFSIINFRFYQNRVKNYIKCLDEHYKNALKDYSEMERIYTRNFIDDNENFKKDQVLFMTDGYYFAIIDDFLIKTKWFMNKIYKTKYNPYPLLKILDADVIGKRGYEFKLSDIEFYKVVGNVTLDFDHEKTEEYMHAIDMSVNDYIEIELNDKTVLKFGTNIYSKLKEIIPYKERDYESNKTYPGTH